MIANSTGKLGYYQVGARNFSQKIPALIYGTEVNAHPRWHFNNNVFDMFDWTQEPVETLGELYRQRAQKIRDTYQYVALSYSGGSDSHNILMAFIKNNIKLDEVYVIWPVSVSERKPTSEHDFSAPNYLSEWNLTVKPRLEWLSRNHPEIKITVRDWTADIAQHRFSEEFLTTRNHNFSPYAELRWSQGEFFTRVSDQGGVVVYGADKPRVCYHEGAYKIYFLDILVQNSLPVFDSSADVELFYWSPDACKLLAKQSHELVKFFELNHHFKEFINWPVSRPSYRQFYEVATRAIIYPDINVNVFQADKFPHLNVGLDCVVADTEVESNFRSMYKRNWDYLKTIVDPKYFTHINGDDTITGFINGMWRIK